MTVQIVEIIHGSASPSETVYTLPNSNSTAVSNGQVSPELSQARQIQAQEPKNSNESLVQYLPGKLGQAFQDNIMKDETVDVKLHLSTGEALVVTENRVMIIKAGSISGAGYFGANCKSFYFNQISSVDLRLSLLGGHIQITVPGSVDPKGEGLLDMTKAENAATFTVDHKERIKMVANMIRERVYASQRKSTEDVDLYPKADISVAKQIKELADLKERGILSGEEFATAKKKLLKKVAN